MPIWRWRIDVQMYKNMAMPPQLSKSQTRENSYLQKLSIYKSIGKV